jgi:hypothetical protein
MKADPVTRLIPVVLITILTECDDRIRGIEISIDAECSSRRVSTARLDKPPAPGPVFGVCSPFHLVVLQRNVYRACRVDPL